MSLLIQLGAFVSIPEFMLKLFVLIELKLESNSFPNNPWGFVVSVLGWCASMDIEGAIECALNAIDKPAYRSVSWRTIP